MKYKTIALFTALSVISSLAFAQIDKLTGTVTNDATMARLRLAYFVHSGPNVDWYVDGEVAVNGGQKQVDIPVGYVNGYLYLEPGTYSFAVVPTGQAVSEALLETEVTVETGHRYTLAVMGQVEDETHAALVIDETAELQKFPTSKDQQLYFIVNNIAGTTTLDIDEDGHGPKGIPYGGYGVAPIPSGKFSHYAITVNGDPNAVVDSGDYGGYGERPGADVLMGFFGHFPATTGSGFDYFDASPNSTFHTLEFLQGFSGAGFEADYQAVTFDTFLEAVEIAGLTELLTTGDPLLVLPPTDAAFAALPKEQFDALMADPKALADVLKNHIVEAYVPKGALATTPGGPFDRSFTNLLGGTTHIGDGYIVNGLNVGHVGSIFTANGTQVHPITRVLLPPTTLSLAVADGEGWSEGLPPNGIWQVELSNEDLAGHELPLNHDYGLDIDKKSIWEGIYTFTLQDGKVIWQKPGYFYCKGSYELVEDVARFSYLYNDCDRQVDDMQWRLEDDGLHLQLVGLKNYASDTNSILFGTKPWQKTGEPTTDTTVWEKGLPPNGKWQVELSPEDITRMGIVRPWAPDWAGTYTLEFQDGKGALLYSGPSYAVNSPICGFTYEVAEDFIQRFFYSSGSACLGITELRQWRLDDEGFHVRLLDIGNAPFYENRAYLEAKPWQKVE